MGVESAGQGATGPRLGVSVGRTVARLGRQLEIALGAVDLTVAQYRTLTQLIDGAEASSSLAAKLAVSRPSASAVVDGLVERGLVDRQHSSQDRRRVSVRVTEKGCDLLADADTAVSARLADILAGISSRQAAHAISGVVMWGTAMDARKAGKRARANTTQDGKPDGS